MSSILRLGVFVVLLASCGCSFFYPPTVLKIGTQKWTRQEFAQLLVQKIKDTSLQGYLNADTIEYVKNQLITDLLVQHIVHRWAKAKGLVVSKKQLKKQLITIQNSYAHPSAFTMYLNEKNISQKEWESSIKYTLLAKKVMDDISQDIALPSTEELKAVYKSNPESFKYNPRIYIRYMFHFKKEPLVKARQLLTTGGKFVAIAKRFSKAHGKEIAHWVEKDVLDVFDKAFLLKKDQISPVWLGVHGYYIIQLLGKKVAHTLSFKEATPIITNQLMEKKKKARFTKWLDTQGKTVVVLKNNEVIKSITVL